MINVSMINKDSIKIDTSNTWIDVETLASLKGITKRGVRISLNKNKYEYKIDGNHKGKRYKIRLSSIEEEYQRKYIEEYFEELKISDCNVIELENFEIKQDKIIPEKQKRTALAKYDLVMSWIDFKKRYKKNPLENITGDKKFIELYNTGLLLEDIFKTLGKISQGSLYRWKALVQYSNDWKSLVGNYKYSSRAEYNTSLDEKQIHVFMKILLSPNSFSIGKAISLTKHILSEKGYDNLPQDVTFRRYADWFKNANYDKWVLAREGQKALKDKVEPYIVRNAKLLKSGQVLIADGHTLNFQVINPFTGKPCRATLIGFLDWKSGGLVGYDIMMEECTQNIASALRNAILKLDHIPDFVYQDNGRAFKSKFFNGDKKFEELGFTGIYQKLGIRPVYATPYNARAKVIERFFLDFQEGFEKLMPSYIGTSIETKPAYMKRNEKLHKAIHDKNSFVPTVEQALIFIEEWLKYKHSQTCPNDKSKTIQEVINETEKQNINESDLDDLMMAQEIKHIGRNGIRFLNSDYFNDVLYGIREKVIIKYSLNDLTYVKVYTLKGEFMCRADRVTDTHPLAYQMGNVKDMEDYKQKITKQKHLKNKTLKAIKEHFSIDDINIIKDKLLEAECYQEENKENEEPLQPITTIEEKENKMDEDENYVQNRKRPFFKENYERYEWHMKNGCVGAEDRAWLSNYIRSEEYKSIYEN